MFIAPKVAKGEGHGPAPDSTSPPAPRPGKGRNSTPGFELGWGTRAAPVLKEEGLQEGGVRCGEETERKTAGRGAALPGPSRVTHPKAKRGREDLAS